MTPFPLHLVSCSVFGLGLVTACSPSSPAGPLRLEASRAGAGTRLELSATPGVKINARLKPALELTDGTVLRFDSPHLTPDSAYFADPPATLMNGRHSQVHGTLRASVCDAHQTVCRTITEKL